MSFAVIAVLGGVLAYAVLNGGVLASRDLSVCLVVLGLMGTLYGRAVRHRSPLPPADSRTLYLTMALLGIGMIQLLPLPVSVIGLVSPARAELLRALPLAGTTLRYAPLSIVPATSLNHMLVLAACTMVFFLVRELSWRQEGRLWTLVLPLLVLALLEAGIGIIQHSAGGSSGTALGTFENRNHYAGFLEMSLPFAVVLGVASLLPNRGPRESSTRDAMIACCVLTVAAAIFLGILYSLSRMGLFAALSSLCGVGAMALGRGRCATGALGIVGGLAVALALSILLLSNDSMIARFAALVPTEGVPTDTRFQIWRDTVQLIAAYPLIGCGLGGYESALMRYKTAAPMFTVNFAHNDYLQLFAEIGVLGMILLFCLGVRILRFTWRAVEEGRDLQERSMALACIGSFIAILLHSFVDFNLYVHSNAILLAWIAGIAVGPIEVHDAARARRLQLPEVLDVQPTPGTLSAIRIED